MAWAYRRGPTFYIGYVNEAGKKVQQASKARTLTEARRLAEELERKAERIRLGLDAPVQADMPYREGVRQYLLSLPPEYRSKKALEGRFKNRILPHLGDILVRQMKPGDVKRMLAANADASPQTREHLRVAVQASYTFFIKDLKAATENPGAEVGKVEIPERLPQFLTMEEVPRLLAVVPPQWRTVVLFALGTAARKAEILGARKTSVLLRERVFVIDRSLGSDTTKGKKERRIPIPEWLVPYLEEQLRTAPGPLLFPNPEGKAWSKTVRLHEIIRRALVRACLVEGYEHVCRRKGCGWKTDEPRSDGTPFPCPKCGFKTWPKGIPKAIRFKDLRSTWATHAAAKTGDIRFVQVVLGHGDPKLTAQRYAFALPEHLREQANRVDFSVSQLQATKGETSPVETNSSEVGSEIVEEKQGHASPGE